jgi:iron complex outermembrane receptor protein
MWGSGCRRGRRRAASLAVALVASATVAGVVPAQSRPAAADLPAPHADHVDAADSPAPGDDFTSLSLEDLMNVDIMNQQVTSVAKHPERLAESPAAVYVISNEDVRRSGMSSIPDLLRLAPGTNVGRINANKWGISARGFNDQYSNKLLVLMDGRAIYRPLFSGVYWETVDYPLGDLDRIEIVRGPGATLWGANAVNGVINIVSKDASQTQGWSAGTRVGTDDSFAFARYGGTIDPETFYRVYAKYRHAEESLLLDTDDGANDELDLPMAGFRIDRFATEADTFTFQGDVFHVEAGNTLNLPIRFEGQDRVPTVDVGRGTGGNLLARWTHEISDRSEFSLQFYFDHFSIEDVQVGYRQDTLDVEFQHRFRVNDRHALTWGAGARLIVDEVRGTDLFKFRPETRDDYLASFFVQEHAILVPERLSLFLGSKFEANSYSGLEVQPSVRAIWTPDAKNSFWGAVSRAVRTPSRWEEDGQIVLGRGDYGFGIPASLETFGNGRMKSEELYAYEAGYRAQLTEQVSFDAAAFYNRYRRLRTLEQGDPIPNPTANPPHVIVPFQVDNRMDATTYGVELSANARVNEHWRLAAGYAWLRVDADAHPSSIDPFSEEDYDDSDPDHQFNVRSYLNVGRDVEVNVAAYFVDHVEQYDAGPFVRFDASVVWRPTKHLEWSAGVQNAFDPQHHEFRSSVNDAPAEIERAFYTQLVFTR